MLISVKTILLSLASLAIAGPVSDANSPVHEKRGMFGPIGTSSPNLAGGNAACDAAPISSFFTGMKPPVSCQSLCVGTYANTI